MENEIWKDIPGYVGIYQVSNYGRIKSLSRLIYRKNGQISKTQGKILSPGIDKYGYYIVVLCNGKKETKTVHRIVALAFINNPNNLPEIDHKDGNRKNNKVENLRWVTRKENANNPISKLRYSHAAKQIKNYKYLMQSVRQIKDGKVIAEYESMREAERQTNIAHSSIKKAINGKLKNAGGFQWEYKKMNVFVSQ